MIKPFAQSIVILLSLAALTGCDMDGTLSVNQSVTLVDKKGRQVPIVAGQSYRTELGKDGDKVKFNIKIGGKEREIRLSPPRGSKLPKYNGGLLIPASQSGQPVDFYGAIETKDYESQDRRGSQSCSTQARVRVCRQVPSTGRDGSSQTEERCEFELRTVTGTQETVYHDVTSTTSGHVSLLAPGSKNVMAQYEGSSSKTEQVITWSGRCETPYGDDFGHDHGRDHGSFGFEDRPRSR